MTDAAVAFALVTAGLNALAALVGGLSWQRFTYSRAFWILLRIAQGAAVAQALFAGVAAALGRRPDDGLYWLYAALPLAVGLIAEQLRVAATQTVLDARGLESSADVGRLDEAAQRSIVVAVVRREAGVMALSAAVVCFLALRAAGTASGL